MCCVRAVQRGCRPRQASGSKRHDNGEPMAAIDSMKMCWRCFARGCFIENPAFACTSGLYASSQCASACPRHRLCAVCRAVLCCIQAMIGMKEGGVRQVIIPPGPLSYPENDPDHVMGPTPTTFSGMRALNFVLYNKGGQMDKTLLINVKLLRVDKPGERGFKG